MALTAHQHETIDLTLSDDDDDHQTTEESESEPVVPLHMDKYTIADVVIFHDDHLAEEPEVHRRDVLQYRHSLESMYPEYFSFVQTRADQPPPFMQIDDSSVLCAL